MIQAAPINQLIINKQPNPSASMFRLLFPVINLFFMIEMYLLMGKPAFSGLFLTMPIFQAAQTVCFYREKEDVCQQLDQS